MAAIAAQPMFIESASLLSAWEDGCKRKIRNFRCNFDDEESHHALGDQRRSELAMRTWVVILLATFVVVPAELALTDRNTTIRGTIIGPISQYEHIGVHLSHVSSTQEWSGPDSDRGVSITPKELVSPVQVNKTTGAFVVEDVEPGLWLVQIRGAGTVMAERLIRVKAVPIVIGPIEIGGHMTISGKVVVAERQHLDEVLLVYAHDQLVPNAIGEKERELAVGADGRFRDDTIPAGDGTLYVIWPKNDELRNGFAYKISASPDDQVSITIDMKNPFRPRFLADVGASTHLTVRLQVGNGSRDHFDSGSAKNSKREVGFVVDRFPQITGRRPRLEITFQSNLQQVTNQSNRAYAELIKGITEIDLDGISSGWRYIQVRESPMMRRFRAEHGIASISAEMTAVEEVVLIPLGAASITGRCAPTEGKDKTSPTMSIGRVFAFGTQQGSIRDCAADIEGNFCLRFLPADAYRLIYWDSQSGWFDFGVIPVDRETLDVGHRKLRSGASLGLVLEIMGESAVPKKIKLRHDSGIQFTPIVIDSFTSNHFVIEHLWPGKWKAEIWSNGSVIGTGEINLKGHESGGLVIQL